MSGYAVQLKKVCPVTIPTVAASVDVLCGCDFSCPYVEKVFADDGADDYKKDYSDFLFKKVVASDTITLELYKGSVKVADLNNNDYGTYYATFIEQPLYIGYVVDWTLIFNSFGGGNYTVRANTTILGNASTSTSRIFKLNKFYPDLAHRTVRLKSIQNGNIFRSEFDFTGLNWTTYLRVNGTFGDKSPTLEEDKYFNSSYVNTQNREQIVNEYSLRCDLIPQSVANIVSENQALANEFFVTDYNLKSEIAYRDVPVSINSIETTHFDDNSRLNYLIVLRDRTQNLIKRNF